jgi:hypothetical protein
MDRVRWVIKTAQPPPQRAAASVNIQTALLLVYRTKWAGQEKADSRRIGPLPASVATDTTCR